MFSATAISGVLDLRAKDGLNASHFLPRDQFDVPKFFRSGLETVE